MGRAVVVRAKGYRTQIQKSCSNMDRIITEMEDLEKEEDDNDDDDYVCGLWKEVGDEYSKLKTNRSAHQELVAQIRIMCGYMMETQGNLPNAAKIVKDAREALEKVEAAENLLEKNVSDWTKNNRRWVRGKKKKKQEQCEKTSGAVSGRWLETLAKQLQPEGTLKNDGVLTNMKIFKKAWFTYTSYMKRECFKMDNRLYCDMLLNQCDPSP